MKCIDREGNTYLEDQGQEKVIRYLYETSLGRTILKVLVKPCVSKAGGWFLDCPISKIGIKPFIKNNNIDMEQYEDREFCSYNDFFTREIKEGYRPIGGGEEDFLSPCDSKLTVYPIESDSTFCIKNTMYSMQSLTKSRKLAEKFKGGQIMVFRLTVSDYHHYGYPVSGQRSEDHFIPGVFHTVNPIANDHFPIYAENTRIFSFIKNNDFGSILMMEVGALMVGRIVNYDQTGHVDRGQEKGKFEFGGSTVIVCVKKDKVEIDEDILINSRQGSETIVKYGEVIGHKKQ